MHFLKLHQNTVKRCSLVSKVWYRYFCRNEHFAMLWDDLWINTIEIHQFSASFDVQCARVEQRWKIDFFLFIWFSIIHINWRAQSSFIVFSLCDESVIALLKISLCDFVQIYHFQFETLWLLMALFMKQHCLKHERHHLLYCSHQEKHDMIYKESLDLFCHCCESEK